MSSKRARPIRLYLAGSSLDQDGLRESRTILEAVHAYEVTSSWLDADMGGGGTAPGLADEVVEQQARQDLADVRRADAVIMVTPTAAADLLSHSGGRHVEVGYALALDKPVIVVGSAENVFQRGLCLTVGNIWQAIDELAEIFP